VAEIFELIDAGDAEGLRDLLRADPAAAAAHIGEGGAYTVEAEALARGNTELAALIRETLS
jgi:hypothetical protein